ncbi:MAG: hypothetical protein DHS20C06_20780 [Hyphobacterium sp.]|nr:MAG: hypothetical protein DHS20C06_20780 [Hyphobacterium sp.]
MQVFNATLTPGGDVEALASVQSRLIAGDIAVVPNFVDPAQCEKIITDTIGWAARTENCAVDTSIDTPSGNWFRRDVNPEKSAVKRVLQTHDFGDIPALNTPMRTSLGAVFDRMARLQAAVSGVPARVGAAHDGHSLHPQIIHYPQGGGYFGRHTHPLEPQRIGLIVSLSERGVAFQTGSTVYYDAQDNAVDLDDWQTAGSVTLFRYDIPHAVTEVDGSAQLAFEQPTGRWVAIMPFH